MVMIVRRQSDLVNTKLSVIPLSDKPYHTNKRKVQKREEIKALRNYPLVWVGVDHTRFV